MSKLVVEGLMHLKKGIEQPTDNFSKREFVLKIPDERGNTKYDQYVPFELQNSKTSLIDNIQTGDKMSVTFNLRGSEGRGAYEGRFFINLVAWEASKLN